MTKPFALTLLFAGTRFFAQGQSDICATAVPLAPCTVIPGGNSGTTTGPDDTYTAGDICATSIDNSVWYSFTPAISGTHTVTLSNRLCTGSTQLELGVFSGSCGSLIPVTCNAGTGLFSASFNATAAQTYFIVIDGTVGSDCGFDIEICNGCNVAAAFTADTTAGNYPLTVNFTNTGTGGTFSHWDFGVLGATYDGTHAGYTYTQPGTYVVSLVMYNGVCADTLTDTITVTGDSFIEIPNVFTPNGDRLNDFFKVGCIGIKTLDVAIYNRWGELVGWWNGTNGSWDGYSVLAGLKVPDGAYFYLVKAEGYDGKVFDEKGTLQLFR